MAKVNERDFKIRSAGDKMRGAVWDLLESYKVDHDVEFGDAITMFAAMRRFEMGVMVDGLGVDGIYDLVKSVDVVIEDLRETRKTLAEIGAHKERMRDYKSVPCPNCG